MGNLAEDTKSYIAGFLDGDGCVMFQLVRRKDYIYGYQIRGSVVFYQHTKNVKQLEWLKKIYRVGYIRERNDDMVEYTIVGIEPVTKLLKDLYPYLRLKRPHVRLALKISKILVTKITPNRLLKTARLVDEFGKLNFSKKRKNTSKVLERFLKNKNLLR